MDSRDAVFPPEPVLPRADAGLSATRRDLQQLGPAAVVRIDCLVTAGDELGDDAGLAGAGHAGDEDALHRRVGRGVLSPFDLNTAC